MRPVLIKVHPPFGQDPPFATAGQPLLSAAGSTPMPLEKASQHADWSFAWVYLKGLNWKLEVQCELRCQVSVCNFSFISVYTYFATLNISKDSSTYASEAAVRGFLEYLMKE